MAKSPQAFRSISEAADELGVAQHVLRFWETKFPFVKPLRRGGGRRFYRPHDLAVLAEIQRLLYAEGYSIRAVQALQRGGRLKIAERPLDGLAERATDAVEMPSSPRSERLRLIFEDLQSAKDRLDRLLTSS